MISKQLVIIGGGASIKEGIKLGLKKHLKNKFVCGINYSYKYFESTYMCCMNYTDFYDTNRNELKELPLIVTVDRPFPSKWEDNTILVNNEGYSLSGILALKLGIKLLQNGEIFLLGYDFGTTLGLTHFYQGEITHRGIAQSAYYTKIHAERDFEQFKDNKVRIYNVSPDSEIDCFCKIDYDDFFGNLYAGSYNQEDLRNEIKEKLNGFKL